MGNRCRLRTTICHVKQGRRSPTRLRCSINCKTPDAKTQKTSTARGGKETHDM
ncbi:hypothetical protein FSP39_019966 [Pinctada imbricata]|uniref:Uncharacterized protein n=1 Tax=Pinctada imbricata TaxID=66713 RepID=A0AA88YQ12_PINIB|nr:hypothetical protein FSP39_019966 [Pinctada imbricata]